MAHAHAHSDGEGDGTFFLDQLFTILASGALGLVAILMYVVMDPPQRPSDPPEGTPFIGRILVKMFFPWVLGGGIAILLMACIRGIAIWQLAGQRRRQEIAAEHGHDHGHSHGGGHEHAHGEACGHDHGHEGECDHDHAHAHSHASVADDEGHDHNWAPWRYMVIAIPVFIYFLGMPRPGFSERQAKAQMVEGGLSDPNRRVLSFFAGAPVMTKVLRKAHPEVRDLRTPVGGKDGFTLLAETAAIPAGHDAWDGDTVILRGQFMKVPGNDREFTLVNWKMTCCRADAIVLEARIVAPDSVQISGTPEVEVRGTLSFQQSDRGKWIPVITLDSNSAITEVG